MYCTYGQLETVESTFLFSTYCTVQTPSNTLPFSARRASSLTVSPDEAVMTYNDVMTGIHELFRFLVCQSAVM